MNVALNYDGGKQENVSERERETDRQREREERKPIRGKDK